MFKSFVFACNIFEEDKVEVLKEQVNFDDEKLIVKHVGLEGDVFKYYKSFNSIYQVVPKGQDNCLAILTVEYEKLIDDSPYPYKHIDSMTRMTKDIESHLK